MLTPRLPWQWHRRADDHIEALSTPERSALVAGCVRQAPRRRYKQSQKRPVLRMTSAEFLAKAWKVANDKARELGWIV